MTKLPKLRVRYVSVRRRSIPNVMETAISRISDLRDHLEGTWLLFWKQGEVFLTP
jgi:hypothetical protein